MAGGFAYGYAWAGGKGLATRPPRAGGRWLCYAQGLWYKPALHTAVDGAIGTPALPAGKAQVGVRRDFGAIDMAAWAGAFGV